MKKFFRVLLIAFLAINAVSCNTGKKTDAEWLAIAKKEAEQLNLSPYETDLKLIEEGCSIVTAEIVVGKSDIDWNKQAKERAEIYAAGQEALNPTDMENILYEYGFNESQIQYTRSKGFWNNGHSRYVL